MCKFSNKLASNCGMNWNQNILKLDNIISLEVSLNSKLY